MVEGTPTYVLTPEGHRKTLATGRVHVNVDAGLIQQITPGGVKVCMYNDNPGVYWTVKGEPVPEKVAAMAGFNVEAFRKQKDFVADQAKARAALKQALASDSMVKHAERGPYTLYDVGGGLAIIYKDGTKLTDDPAPFAAMKELFDAFAVEELEPLELNLGKEAVAAP